VSTKRSLSLELDEQLTKENIVRSFVYDEETSSLVLKLGGKYNGKTIISSLALDDEWKHNVEELQKDLTREGVEENQIHMICDTVDKNTVRISAYAKGGEGEEQTNGKSPVPMEAAQKSTTIIANAVDIRSTAAVVPWTSAFTADQLLIDLCKKETTLSADILEDLSKKQTFDSGRRIYVLKYRTEFLHVAHLISATDYSCFLPFRIDPRDLDTRVLKEILAVDRETQDMIMMDVINRILRSSNKLLYLEHIQPNRRHLSWKWEEFDFGLGSGKVTLLG
jgi:hypothetical protein